MSPQLVTGGETIKNPRQFSLRALLLLTAFYCVTFAATPWLLEHGGTSANRYAFLRFLVFAWVFPPSMVLSPRLLVGLFLVSTFTRSLIKDLSQLKLVEVTFQFHVLLDDVFVGLGTAILLALALLIRKKDLDSGFLQNSRAIFREIVQSRSVFLWWLSISAIFFAIHIFLVIYSFAT